MGQVRRGSAAATFAVSAAIGRAQAQAAALHRKSGIKPKTVAKWRMRETFEDRRTGPEERKTGPAKPRSTFLGKTEKAMPRLPSAQAALGRWPL